MIVRIFNRWAFYFRRDESHWSLAIGKIRIIFGVK
jgi:hypothetical protein